jgi:serine/threonine-protein kinase HipA
MGALTYEPDRSPDRSLENQTIDYYQKEVEKILKEDYTGSLQELMNKAGSSGGARPKILLACDDGHWLVKFRSNLDPAEIGKIEYHYSLLAKSCGIEMSETCLMEGKYFATKRFDIEGDKRIHVHSAAGLLHASHRLPSLDYSGLMKATTLLTRDLNETEKMFRLMVFNVLIGNKDDHAKNFSFLFKNGQWIVSPAYDLLPSEGFNGHHTTSVNGNGKPGISDCLAVAKESSFPITRAETIIEEVENGLKSHPTPL